MSDNITRYFKGNGTAVVVARVTDQHETSFVGNAFVLSDPEDLKSKPGKGWEEISEDEFGAEQVRLKLAAEKSRKTNIKADEAAHKVVYDEALALGFSSAAATTLSGFTPPA